MEEDDTMRNYIKQTNRKLDLTETEVADLKAGIGDTNNTWDQAQKDLANALYAQGLKWGVIKQHLES